MPAVRTIVRESGGDIEIRSRPGSGTCVRIRFSRTAAPIPKPRIARRKRTQRPEPRATTARRILLVEDDPLVRQALATIIGRSGHTQFVAHSGIEAVKFLQSDLGRFWGALVDLTLPGEIDGIGVMERIREVSKETFVVLMSGFDRSHVMDLVRAAPPDGFLQKPFGSDALLEEIRRLETLAKPPRSAADPFIPADAPPPADPIRPTP
jgi:CheY-like chemotaxis protein